MKAAGEVEQVETGGPSHPVDGLSRCAACYKQQTSSMHRWGRRRRVQLFRRRLGTGCGLGLGAEVQLQQQLQRRWCRC
ncbi:hypothetical protein FQN60_011505 [Etheostoma spectabile]|uniref:Uncharacterized protein n=1 Tax=Etheostoma spectabile TaxID=54343 RepID=A0A5J5C6M8_9PERO|nr:hypothetical protein FQN60_011505 [Etheostoma spectabile]